MKNENNFSLNGRLIGQDTGIIILRYVPESTWKFDTANIRNERFQFQGEIFEPTRATLLNGEQQVEFYIEPGKINIAESTNCIFFLSNATKPINCVSSPRITSFSVLTPEISITSLDKN